MGFDSRYCSAKFGCGWRANKFDVRGFYDPGSIRAALDIDISMAVALGTYNYVDNDWTGEAFSVKDLEWHAGKLWVFCSDGKLYRRESAGSYTYIATTPDTPAGYLGRLMSFGDDLFVAARKASGGKAAVFRLDGTSLVLEVESSYNDQRPLYDGGSYLYWQGFTFEDGVDKLWARRDGAGSWTWDTGPTPATYGWVGQRSLFGGKRLAGYSDYYSQGSPITKSSVGGSVFPTSGLRAGEFDSKLWLPYMGDAPLLKLASLETYAGGWTKTDSLSDTSTYRFNSCAGGTDFLLVLGQKRIGLNWAFAAFHFDGTDLSEFYVSGELAPTIIDHVADGSGNWLYVATEKKIYRIPPP